MTELVECVPNVSEGRDAGAIRALADTIESAPDVRLLDVHQDADHHRSVFTFLGSVPGVEDAAFRLAAAARDAIDLRHHRGQHRRIGAIDVVPFVPIAGVTADDCVALAKRTGHRIAADLDVPVFLYGWAARTYERAWLPHVRGEGLESLEGRMRGALTPDAGPQVPHPTAGATAVGARSLLLAFNICLDSTDPSVARRIAATIRTSGGGLPGVQALGFIVDGHAQVSMNLFDLKRTDAHTVFDAVRRRAEGMGVQVLRSEIVGLAPRRALPPDPIRQLRLDPAPLHTLDDHVGRYYPEVGLPLPL